MSKVLSKIANEVINVKMSLWGGVFARKIKDLAS